MPAQDQRAPPSLPPDSRGPRFGRTFAALRHRNYRLWFVGQLVSLVGSWMQITAQGYLVYELTRSPAYLGLVGFANGVPAWLFMLLGGVAADRVSRRRLLIASQTAMMLLAAVLAMLTFSGQVQAWHIVALTFGLGIANAFDAPARQAFVVEMVAREDLGNAIALNSLIFNLASALGPAAAGVLYALLGPGWCFTLNALSFVAVLVALLFMRVAPKAPTTGARSAVAELREGLAYVVGERRVAVLLALVIAMSLFGVSFVTLMPAWAVSVLGGDARTYGFLQSARGVGALLGALILATWSQARAPGRTLSLGSLVFPVLILAFAASRSLPLSLLVLVGVGWGFLVFFNGANLLLQTLTPDHLRGRVMSIYTLTFFGFMPVGSLFAGALAERFGEPATVALGAALCLVVAGAVWWKVPQLREAI